MNRVMIIPAAGRGSRLGSSLPKLLVPVRGRPMIEHLLEQYRGMVSRFLLVVSPEALDQVRAFVTTRAEPTEIMVQKTPTGMLDAIVVPLARVRQLGPDEVWITWCDQVAVHRETVRRLSEVMQAGRTPALGFPTAILSTPYIHFVRHPDGGIARVLHRREGDAMPDRGEGDIGLFALGASTYLDLLPLYLREAPLGAATGERNFLPFIPWLASRSSVRTVPATGSIEAVGINTPEELLRVEAYLATAEVSRPSGA